MSKRDLYLAGDVGLLDEGLELILRVLGEQADIRRLDREQAVYKLAGSNEHVGETRTRTLGRACWAPWVRP